jgi:hypothetical protein
MMMKRVGIGIVLMLFVVCLSRAQAPTIHPAFRMKLIEAVQDVDALNDPLSFPIEEGMNRVQARRSVQELGRTAATPQEVNIAFHIAQHLLSVRTCIFSSSTSTSDATRDCFANADKERDLALKLAGMNSVAVYPHEK